MEEILYNSLNTYFKTISVHGYRSYSTVYKILVTDFLNDFIKEFNELLSTEDRHLIQSLLYCFFETTCEISAPPKDCTCQSKPKPVVEVLKNFRLIPSSTTYNGTQNVIFTGAAVTIDKTNPLTENSLAVYWNDEVLKSGLANIEDLTFNPTITKTLVQDTQYTAKASIIDIDGIEHFSNIFTITVKPLSTPKYMYTGIGAVKPTVSEVLAGAKHDFNQVQQFTTPAMIMRTIWIALPIDITLISMENANFAGDYLYNIDTGRDILTKEDITLDGKSYRLYYLTTIKTNNPYIVKVQGGGYPYLTIEGEDRTDTKKRDNF